MTVEQILQLYMQKRRELLTEGTPLSGWTVRIHPVDAQCLEAKLKEHHPFLQYVSLDTQHFYGALWVRDASVQQGNICVEVGDTK